MFSTGDIVIISLRLILDGLIIYIFVHRLISLSYDPRIIGATMIFAALFATNFFSRLLGFPTTLWISGKFIEHFLIVLIILFQPEIRKIILGIRPPFVSKDIDIKIIDEIAEASKVLAERKEGAIIVLERMVDTTTFVQGGKVINADLSTELISTIFNKNSSIHDGAMIVKGDKIHMVSAVLPISRKDIPNVGMRHRAGVGITEETDAISIIISDTGKISLAISGNLLYDITPDLVRAKLYEMLKAKSR